LVVLGSSSPAYAGGIFSGHKGARVAGRAGAFTAKADDISAVLYNPAGLAKVGTTLLQVGNRFSFHPASFTRAPVMDTSFATVRNEQIAQALDPMIGVVTNFGKLENWGFALTIMAPPGIARAAYPIDGGQRYMMVSRESVALNYALSAAWKHKNRVGVGASVQWIHTPILKYQTVVNGNILPQQNYAPVSSELDLLATIDGRDLFAFNAVLGAWFRPIQALELGISGQIVPSAIKAKATLDLEMIDEDSEFEPSLSRDRRPANDVTLTVPLPLSARIGARYRHLKDDREVFDIELDVSYEAWSFVDQFTVDTKDLEVSIGSGVAPFPVGTIAIEKRWRHVFGVHLGSDIVAIPDRFVVRAGLGYESPTARRAYTNVDFATGHHLLAGVGFSVLVKGFEIAAAYDFRGMLPVDVTVDEGRVYQQVPGSPCVAPYTDETNCAEEILGQPAAVVNAGRYTAQSHAASLELIYRF